jgi:hypothetical protein
MGHRTIGACGGGHGGGDTTLSYCVEQSANAGQRTDFALKAALECNLQRTLSYRAIPRVAGLTEAMMNKPDVQQGAQFAAHDQSLAAVAVHGPKESSSKPLTSGAELAPAAAKPGNETVSMGSPAFGLDGRPVSKDAIHLNT